MENQNKNPFSLHDRYQQYLKLVNLNEENMGTTQRLEMKRTFIAACGIMLTMMRDEISLLSENDAIKVFENMTTQVGDFFLKEANRKN